MTAKAAKGRVRKAPSGRRRPASSPRGRSRGKKKARAGWLARIAKGLLWLVALTSLGGVGAYAYFSRDLPTIDQLRNYHPPQTNRVVDRNGAILGEFSEERRTVVPISEVPRVFVLSVLAAEDADFYEHEGLDYPGLARAVFRALWSQARPRGTSTITQQVVKLLLLSPERTVSRKIRELILARRLEQSLSKDEILGVYINHINFGHARYGVQEAAQFYFGKDAADLNLNEASMLAGIPQSPRRLSPRSHPDAARTRQLFVLSQLEKKRDARWPDLSLEALESAKAGPPELRAVQPNTTSDPALASYARTRLTRLVGEEAITAGGYTVALSIDATLQTKVRAALRKGLEAIDARHRYRGPIRARRRRPRSDPEETTALRTGTSYLATVTGTEDADTLRLEAHGQPGLASIPQRYNPDELAADAFAEVGARLRVSLLRPAEGPGELAEFRLELGPQGAVVVLDVRTREVLALVGGYSNQPGFNRATQARRQPGSTFKPLVYALALKERLYTVTSRVLDAPQVYGDYRPSDFASRSYRGEISLRESLAVSANPVAKQLIDRVGPKAAVLFAQALGIASPLEATVPLALGASEVTPLELVNAYATFPAGGHVGTPKIVRSVTGPGGSAVTIERPEAMPDVLKPAEAYLVTSLLQSVISDGTGRAARALRRPAAGKTGTSNNARDAWFVGFTPDIVCGVWVGFDDRRGLGRRESGSRAALPIWIEAMRAATAGSPRAEFPEPAGLVHVSVDPASGLVAYEGMEGAVDEVFLAGTEPTEVAAPPDVMDSNTFLMQQFGNEPEAPAEASP